MDAQNPNKIDLRKSEMFKQWKRLNEQTNSDILTQAIKETIEGNDNKAENSDSEHSEAENSDSEHSEAENSDSEHSEAEHSASEHSEAEHGASEHSEAEHNASEHSEANNNWCEAVVTENPMWGLDEGLLAAQQVDQLVNQMALDDELRALLDSEPEDDEGIELNIHDELEMDIEPFDFRLEVELADW